MAKRSAVQSEKLTAANLDRVISLLGAEKPITKKAACELLGIAYNTTRLNSLLKDHTDKQNYFREQVEKKKGTPASESEIALIISGYLVDGKDLTSIARSLYRGVTFVRSILVKYNVPLRTSGSDSYINPALIPESCIRDEFEVGSVVYSARYESLAEIRGTYPGQPNSYRIWLLSEKWQQFAYQPPWELADMSHLAKYLQQ